MACRAVVSKGSFESPSKSLRLISPRGTELIVRSLTGFSVVTGTGVRIVEVWYGINGTHPALNILDRDAVGSTTSPAVASVLTLACSKTEVSMDRLTWTRITHTQTEL